LCYVPLSVVLSTIGLRMLHCVRQREQSLLQAVQAESAARRQLCLSAIETLASTLEARNPENLGHLSRVQAISVRLGSELGLSEDELDGLRVSAMLHDIGRLGIPDSILQKDGRLSEDEYSKVKAYPVLGARLLSDVPFPWPVVETIRHHRERFDGTGYPDGICGEDIPLGSRILAVADTYESLTRTRAYRASHTPQQAVDTIRDSSGRLFDPRVVDAFCRIAGELETDEQHPERLPHSPAHEIARAHREVQAVHDLARAVGSTLDLNELTNHLAQHMRSALHADSCVVFLMDSTGLRLRASAAVGANAELLTHATARTGTFLTGRAASRGETICATYMPPDLEFPDGVVRYLPIRTTLVIPLRVELRTIGTINLYHSSQGAFGADEIRTAGCLAEIASRALENAREYTETRETALTDALTGLRNARYMRIRLAEEMNRAVKTGAPLALLGMDLDGFKQINDNYGHAKGDEVLREAGRILTHHVRNYDLAVRIAGDEFAVLLPDTDMARAEVVSLKIKGEMERYGEMLREGDPAFPRLGVSIGVAMYPEDGGEMDSLLHAADVRMYRDKRLRKAA
jgi:diguanylate cyclase (GGDEF)-like protein